jgi:hypothetical protein
MATQTVILSSHPGERGSRLELWSTNPVAMVQSVAADEPVWMSGIYKGDFIDAPEASYVLQHIDGSGKPLWTSFVALTLTTDTFVAHEAALASGGGGGGLDAAGVRAAIGMATNNMDAQLTAIGNAAASADTKLTTTRLSRIDRIPDVAAGAASGLAIVGSAMNLSATAQNAVRDGILNRVLAGNHDIDGSPGKLLQTASAESVISALASGTQIFGHSYEESIKRIEMASGAATLSGAGSGTEVMTSSDGLKTATFTVDDDGNVSAVVWT